MTSAKPAMMRQWADIKRSAPGCVVMFRLGDFYEAFNEDAGILAEVCDLTLTSRPVKKGQRVPMAGVPYHAVDGYIAQLVRAGHKVALVEQQGAESSPEKRARMSRAPVADAGRSRGTSADARADGGATGEGAVHQPGLPNTGVTARKPKILSREIVRVVTAGTLVEGELLEADANNYLVALHGEWWHGEAVGDAPSQSQAQPKAHAPSKTSGMVGLAQLDISTGEFLTTEWSLGDGERSVWDELLRLRPAELLVPEQEDAAGAHRLEELTERLRRMELSTRVEVQPSWRFEAENARRVLLEHFDVRSLTPFGCADKPYATGAAAAALAYANQSQRGRLAQVTRLATWTGDGHMTLDAMTRRNLELTATLRGGKKQGTLLWVLDTTKTAMGARRLRGWVERPLLDPERIARRQDAVEYLVDDGVLRPALRDELSTIPDIERLINRVLGGYAGPRELLRLAGGLRAAQELATGLEDADAVPADLAGLLGEDVSDVAERVEETLAEEPPATLGVAGVVRPGFSAELDAVHAGVADARDWIAALEARERERSGIQRIKVGYNKVFGYYLNVPKSQADRVPADYQRKQTLVDSERYVTPALKERELEVLSAEERILGLERSIYHALVSAVAERASAVLSVARDIGALDAVAALAETAVNEGWRRPVLDDGRGLEIREGRHPVVERMQRDVPFVPNDLHLADGEIALLTGPNMAGKSTVGRQAALIVLLAHMGSFVPAAEARIGLTDRVFARIGAQDEIAEGRSTFMVEMVETALILHHATPRSLVILDELGRGTSTYDGIAIAWALIERLHDDPRLGCRTVFATHYHELTQLAERLERVRNIHMVVSDSGGGVVFLHRVEDGAADRSYGVHVAELAGLPSPVTKRAWELLHALEAQAAQDQAGRGDGAIAEENNANEADGAHGAPGRPGGSAAAAATVDPARDARGAAGPQAPQPAAHPDDAILRALREIAIEDLTPLDALNRLADLQRQAREGRAS